MTRIGRYDYDNLAHMEGSMSNEQATSLAKHVYDDLRGASYYADPKILGGLVKGDQATAEDKERAGIQILSHLLRKHLPKNSSDMDIKELAKEIESMGVR